MVEGERADVGWWGVGGRMVEEERGQMEGGGVLEGGWWRERERADGGWWSVGGRMVEGERGQTEGGGVLEG